MAEPGTGCAVSSVGLQREANPEILPMKGDFAQSTLVLGTRLEKVPAGVRPDPHEGGWCEGIPSARTEVKHREGAGHRQPGPGSQQGV